MALIETRVPLYPFQEISAMRRSRIQASVLATLLLLFVPALSLGQTEKGAIVGLVTDSTGSVIPNASVTVTNLATNTSQSFTTNNEGLYEAPFLAPANYKVTVSSQGFSTVLVNSVVVNVGQRQRMDVTLQPGSISEEVVA